MTLEADRKLAITRNRALLKDLNILRPSSSIRVVQPNSESRPPPSKKRRVTNTTTLAPSRASARIANAQPTYKELPDDYDDGERTSLRAKRPEGKKPSRNPASRPPSTAALQPPTPSLISHKNIESLRAGWSSWTPAAPPPTRSPVTSQFHFPSHPTFTPNKSPLEMLREGCFGGSYFRPLYSRYLGTTIENDWKELPEEWIQGLDVNRYLTNPEYDPEVNKFKVKCGQSIEEWELAGWINHTYDVWGWFQWYCRFFQGRRCDDDERQVSRWAKCVGPKGRWRSLLMKKYVSLGVREVFDDGEEEEGSEVSPVMHQTCHQWGWEVRQEGLDEVWRGRGGG